MALQIDVEGRKVREAGAEKWRGWNRAEWLAFQDGWAFYTVAIDAPEEDKHRGLAPEVHDAFFKVGEAAARAERLAVAS